MFRARITNGVRERIGALAEDLYAFWPAARWYRRAADELAERGHVDPAAFLLMRAARSLQKGENWRTQAASWELLGDRLGREVPTASIAEHDARYHPRPGREKVEGHYVISDRQWRHPGQDYGGDVGAFRQHRQGNAYQWAAECALADLQFGEAARLYRKAGVAWQASQRAHKEMRAADCYFQAALSAAQSSRLATRRKIVERWCPSCMRDKTSEDGCEFCEAEQEREGGLRERLKGDGEGWGSDLERLRACWASTSSGSEDPEEDFRIACRQFAAIQGQLASGGARDEAIDTYRFRQQFIRSHYRRRRPLRYLRSAGGWLVSGNLSSVKRLVTTLVVLYAGLFPAFWWASHFVRVDDRSAAGPFDSLVFSLSSTTTLTPSRFDTTTAVATLFQALQALSGYFALGIALWVSQRSYDAE